MALRRKGWMESRQQKRARMEYWHQIPVNLFVSLKDTGKAFKNVSDNENRN